MLRFRVPTRVKTLNFFLSMNQTHNAWHPRPSDGRGQGVRATFRAPVHGPTAGHRKSFFASFVFRGSKKSAKADGPVAIFRFTHRRGLATHAARLRTMNETHCLTVAAELKVRPQQVAATARLLAEGATVGR